MQADSRPTLRFPRASSPASTVPSKRCDFLPLVPPRFVSFAWRYLSLHSFSSLLSGRVRRSGLELVPGGSSRDVAEETTGSPKSSWGTPIVRLHMFHTDAGRTAGTRPLQCRGVALGHRTAKAPARGLSTLNSMAFGLAVYASQCRLPCPTQDSLPAAGQALPDGLSTRKVPLKGFRSASTHAILSQASWRNQWHRRALNFNLGWCELRE